MKATLKILYCSENCEIDQNGISQLNLMKLYAHNNEKIKNVNHMKNTLKILNCSGSNCAIDQNGISELNLIKLYASENNKIKNVNHMKNTLKILDWEYEIDQNGISDGEKDNFITSYESELY